MGLEMPLGKTLDERQLLQAVSLAQLTLGPVAVDRVVEVALGDTDQYFATYLFLSCFHTAIDCPHRIGSKSLAAARKESVYLNARCQMLCLGKCKLHG